MDRLRELARKFVHQHDAGRVRQCGLGFVHRDRPGEFDVDGQAVGDPHRYADAGRRDTDGGVAEDFASLVDDLVLFFGVPVGVERPIQRDDVPRELRLVRRRGGHRLPEGVGLQLRIEVGQPCGPLPGRRLIRRHNDALNGADVVQRFQRHCQRDGDAIRIRHDPLAGVVQFRAVHLGHDERAIGVHPPRRRIVNDDGPGLRGDRAEFFADATGGTAQDDLHAVERTGLQEFDGVRFPREFHPFPHRFLGGEELDEPNREFALDQNAADHNAHGPGRPYHRHVHAHGNPLRSC